MKNQVLLGVTGSGKTFTLANVINRLQIPTLIISHNKTLAGQLYQEFRDYFPSNAVSYFVSYYDYYQPEAYIPASNTYIEKEAEINEQIDKLRLASTANILTRKDVIVVASVSCIYNIGSPKEYSNYVLSIAKNQPLDFKTLSIRLIDLQYDRSEFEFKRGTFRLRGNSIDIYPAYDDIGFRITLLNDIVISIEQFEPISGKLLQNKQEINQTFIYPAKHFMMDKSIIGSAEVQIRKDLQKEHAYLLKQGKSLEAQRLMQRVNYDLELIKEVGYVNGIENYSRYFDGRKPGDPPYSLLHYFKEAYGDNFLVCIDESHMTVPQIRGMYNGDHSRKTMLIDYGFRLKAAYDNRPLRFDEFYQIPHHIIYTSATPDKWEINEVKNQEMTLPSNYDGIAQQLIRPTGIIDPMVYIRPAKTEIQDLMQEIEKRVVKKERVLVTTLTKKTAEDLTLYFKDKNIKSSYLHSDVETLERSNILDKLRKNDFDVLIGVNLLREGLDLPEVSLVAILDADKEGFLRSKTSLIQTMGRAARNIKGEIILYADVSTKSIEGALQEINRRRQYQLAYNKEHGITPKSIIKPIRERIADEEVEQLDIISKNSAVTNNYLKSIKQDALTPFDTKKLIKKLEHEMKRQAQDMNFELAIAIRDKIKDLKNH